MRLRNAGAWTLTTLASLFGFIGCADDNDSNPATPNNQPTPEEWPVTSDSTRLELEETLGGHFGTQSSTENPVLLQNYTLEETDGLGGTQSVTCTQTLDFGDVAPRMVKDDNGNVAVYLLAKANQPVYTWRLNFQDGFTSNIDANGNLTELLQENIFMCGKMYRITKAQTQWLGGDIDEVVMEMLTGKAVMPFDSVAPSQTLRVDGVDYQVDYAGSRTASDGSIEVNMIVNGQNLGWMRSGATALLANGARAGVFDAGSGYSEFGIGVKKVVVKDGNIGDDEFEGNLQASPRNRVKGVVDPSTGTINLEHIAYRLLSNVATQKAIFVGSGELLSDKMDNPADAIVDIQFDGLTVQENPPTEFNFYYTETANDSAYTLNFTAKGDLEYQGVAVAGNDGTAFTVGNPEGEKLVITEGTSSTEYNIGTSDRFVVTNSQGATRIFKYKNFDSYDPGPKTGVDEITLEDLAGGEVKLAYDANGQASLSVDGETCTLYVDTATGYLTGDLNCDGKIDGAAVEIVNKHGGRLSFVGNDSVIEARIKTLADRIESMDNDEVLPITFYQNGTGINADFALAQYENPAGEKKGQSVYGVIGQKNPIGDMSAVYPETQEQAHAVLKELQYD